MSTVRPALLAFATFIIVGFFMEKFAERARTANREFLLHQLDKYATIHFQPEKPLKREPVLRKFITNTAEIVVTPVQRRKLRLRLEKAGLRSELDLDATARRKVEFGLIGLIIPVLMSLTGAVGWLLAAPLFAVGAYFLPEVLLFNEANKRVETVSYTLADAIDLLSMCVEAGLSFEAALGKVSETQSGPIAEEFGAVLTELQLGKSRSEALRDLAERNDQKDLQRFVTSMQQVDRLGVPVSVVIQEQAREMRAARRERAREQAQKVPIKILMPVMLCFLPGMFIVILGPAVINIFTAFSNM